MLYMLKILYNQGQQRLEY